MGYDANPQLGQDSPAPERLLMKGAEAIAEAAIRAGCKNFFGYPITPQNEIPEYMSARLPEVGGTFVQAESEVASINMLYGAGATGVRCMTSSSSPGLSLMAEGFSYLIGSEVPTVVVNIMRGGPGLGNIAPSQGDYLMMTRGFGHGDQKAIVLAPASVQEAVDLMSLAFDLAEKYRNPVVVIGDGLIGQMMEPVTFSPQVLHTTEKPWATTGKPATRKRNIINSLYLDADTLEQHVLHLFEKFARMEAEEQRSELYLTDDQPEIVICAFGTTARIAKSAIKVLRSQGISVGLFRPISAWPFPEAAFQTLVAPTKAFLSIEMSMGQLVQDIRTLVAGRKPVEFWGRTGGVVPTTEEMVAQVQKLHAKLAARGL
jgi:2-oxoglutarate ferredoxin oxidoreductase subunit alpha